MDDDAESLRRRAQSFRKIALLIMDGRAIEALIETADELEQRANELSNRTRIDQTDDGPEL